ncbi:MAG: dihydrolipoyl dehydrogenase [Roseitalea porphyridii]|uniref:dihydrolipoyl dehydrogenase n=1 Tax=Roseitalea porphyridii TaxID=1852022 RepID=UPI0032D8FCCB
MSVGKCSLLVLGAGPGGYVCAIRAGQMGIDTVIVDEMAPGGTCLNVGCIPSKALIHAANEFHKITHASEQSALGIKAAAPTIDLGATVGWKDAIVRRLNGGVEGLFKKAGVRHIRGRGEVLDGKTVRVFRDGGEETIRTDALVLATGSMPTELPKLPFGGKVISSTEALSLSEPPAALAVVGGGYIGLELGTAYAKLGSRVTVIEAEQRILPQYDAALTRPVEQSLERLRVTVLTRTKALELSDKGLCVQHADDGPSDIDADRILVTTGRTPRIREAGIEGLALTLTQDGFIAVDDRCATSMRGVYAIGDITGDPMLAHKAMAQGELVAEVVAGHRSRWDRTCIPAVCFTDPEIVTCGLLPDEAAEKGFDVSVGQFPLAASGRAMTMEAASGFVRAVAERDTGRILGLQAVGRDISELSTAFAIAIEMGVVVDDIAGVIHAHPTLGEGLQEACFAVGGKTIHV